MKETQDLVQAVRFLLGHYIIRFGVFVMGHHMEDTYEESLSEEVVKTGPQPFPAVAVSEEGKKMVYDPNLEPSPPQPEEEPPLRGSIQERLRANRGE